MPSVTVSNESELAQAILVPNQVVEVNNDIRLTTRSGHSISSGVRLIGRGSTPPIISSVFSGQPVDTCTGDVNTWDNQLCPQGTLLRGRGTGIKFENLSFFGGYEEFTGPHPIWTAIVVENDSEIEVSSCRFRGWGKCIQVGSGSQQPLGGLPRAYIHDSLFERCRLNRVGYGVAVRFWARLN